MKRGILCFTDRPSLVQVNAKCEWDICFVSKTEQALGALANKPFEAVAADGGPGVNAASSRKFLNEIRMRFPGPLRLLLYKPTEQANLSGKDALIHQYVTLPTSTDVLVAAVERARFVGRMLNARGMDNLLPQLRKLPSVPSIYFRVLQALKSMECDLEQVGAIMAQDPALTAKLLHVANSAYFGLASPVTSPADAIAHLGLEQTKGLILIAHLFSAFEAEKQAHFCVERFWEHSITVGRFARSIVNTEAGGKELGDAAYCAGLLHDVGKFILAANCPQKYNEVLEYAFRHKTPFVKAEEAVLGATHTEIAACILGTWGLPTSIVEGLAFHHSPRSCGSRDFSVTTAVHAADLLYHSFAPDGLPTLGWDLEYLDGMGLSDRVLTWSAACAGAPAPPPKAVSQ